MTADETRGRFATIVSHPDATIDLAEAALVIAHLEFPEIDTAAYVARIDDLALDARARVGDDGDPYAVANTVSEYLFDETGLRGNSDDYYDPRHSFLNCVLGRKLGIPITLSIVYMEVTRRLGLPIVVEGAGMPGHFLVRFSMAGETLLLDPFHRGVILEREDVARIAAAAGFDATALSAGEIAPAVGTRDILARMLNNLKQIYLNQQDFPRCLQAVELALCIEPDHPQDVRLSAELRRLL